MREVLDTPVFTQHSSLTLFPSMYPWKANILNITENNNKYREIPQRDRKRYYFSRDPSVSEDLLDEDGLPRI